MIGLVDHMWQTLQVIGCLAFMALITRQHSARFRVWLWRIAAVKLVVPFAALHGIGEIVGFPVPHSTQRPPQMLMTPLDLVAPWVAPARHVAPGWRWALLAVLTVLIVLALLGIHRALRAETPRVAEERRRLEHDPDDRPPGLGFVRGLVFSAAAMLVLVGSLLCGAIDDRLYRQELLRRNEAALASADVGLKPAAPGMGSRVRISADTHGVTIRNATLQEIGGIAYGVSVYLVRGQHFAREGEPDWLKSFRYDVRVTGPVVEPESFDTYALRTPLTRALAIQFGLEIHHNGKCQPPCGRWGTRMSPAATRAP